MLEDVMEVAEITKQLHKVEEKANGEGEFDQSCSITNPKVLLHAERLKISKILLKFRLNS